MVACALDEHEITLELLNGTQGKRNNLTNLFKSSEQNN